MLGIINSGCSPNIRRRRKPNVVLISLDTLGAEYFTPLLMPFLHEYSRSAMVFTTAHANATWTLPSHVSLFSGVPLSEHGVNESFNRHIPTEVNMIQETLKEDGYNTISINSGGYVSSEFGFDRGFDEVVEIEIPWAQVAATDPESNSMGGRIFGELTSDNGEALDSAKLRIKNKSFKQPFYAFVHTFQVHNYPAKFHLLNGVPIEEDLDVSNLSPNRILKYYHDKYEESTTMEERKAFYIEGVKECDSKLEELLTTLHKVYPDTIVIVLSDHGEGFGEHYSLCILRRPSDYVIVPSEQAASGDDSVKEYICIGHGGIPVPVITHVPLIIKYGDEIGVYNELHGLDEIPGTILKKVGLDKNLEKSVDKPRKSIISERIFFSKRKDSFILHSVSIDKEEKFLLSVGPYSPDNIPRQTPELSPEKAMELRALGYLD